MTFAPFIYTRMVPRIFKCETGLQSEVLKMLSFLSQFKQEVPFSVKMRMHGVFALLFQIMIASAPGNNNDNNNYGRLICCAGFVIASLTKCGFAGLQSEVCLHWKALVLRRMYVVTPQFHNKVTSPPTGLACSLLHVQSLLSIRVNEQPPVLMSMLLFKRGLRDQP